MILLCIVVLVVSVVLISGILIISKNKKETNITKSNQRKPYYQTFFDTKDFTPSFEEYKQINRINKVDRVPNVGQKTLKQRIKENKKELNASRIGLINSFINVCSSFISLKFEIYEEDDLNILGSICNKYIRKRIKKYSPDRILSFTREFDPKNSHVILIDIAPIIYKKCTLLPISSKLNIARFIVNKSFDQKVIDSTYRDIIAIATDNKMQSRDKANAIDILNLSNNTKYKEMVPELLNKVREQEEKKNIERIRNLNRQLRAPINPFRMLNPIDLFQDEIIEIDGLVITLFDNVNNTGKKRNIYEDTQNVHTKEINESVLETAKNLVEKYPFTTTYTFDIDQYLTLS